LEKLIQKIKFQLTRMETQLNSNPAKKEIDLDFKESKYATGRRKRSIARVWLKRGSGNIYINGKKMTEYFKKIKLQNVVCRPLTVIEREKEFDIKCSVKGGGLSGQAGAIIHGIARALIEFEPSLRAPLKKEKLNTRDSRSVERKKYGRKKARRSFQFSKR
jgi:small subunit ribosomal protein S9